jgi:uncharacterized protein YbgA (DUF1722 family)/uncharacterized protein YbbK (DUF523 family)
MLIAVSACLLGQKVRFDGGHKHDRFVTESLGTYAEYLPFCPEQLAFGTPRPSIRLVRDNALLWVESNKTHEDLSNTMEGAIAQEMQSLQDHQLSGIIFKSRSPSCGMGSAKVYLTNGYAEGKDDGVFVRACKAAYPLVPMEEEARLIDPWLRENFVMQLFAYDAFETFKANQPAMRDLVAFHTRYKFLLQAKDEQRYRELGGIVAHHDGQNFTALLSEYETVFKTAIAQKSSIKRNRNVLEHMAGFFKRQLSSGEKATLHEQIEDYAKKITPIITPLSTISLFAKKYEIRYLLNQAFLEPYPKELALRSHIGSGK